MSSPGAAPAPTSPPSPPPNNGTSSPPPAPAASPPSPPAATPPPAASPPAPVTTPPPTPTPSPPAPTTPAPASSPPPPPSSTPSPPPASTTPSPPPASTSPPSPPSTTPPPPAGSSPSPPSSGNPPPASERSPPPPRGGSSTPTGSNPTPPPPSPTQNNNNNNNNTPLIIGIAVGAVAILVIISLIFIVCKKKKRRSNGAFDYYGPPPSGPKVDPYGGPAYQWQHNAPPPGDHIVSIPPKINPPPGGASRPPLSPVRAPPSQAPPPPPAYMSSSGGSGSNHSGPENPLPPPSPGMAYGFSKSTFTYEELAMATDGFSNANLLGQGGFGYVHRGILPKDGKEVAVKQLKTGSGQGEREFQAEVEIISRVHHKHLVSLVGYCITGSRRLLVYEFVPNNTLEFHLHGKGRPALDWPTRLKIALGSAKGLAYLHEDCHPKIFHRDIKAANILLDFNFEAKVADFGLAKFSSDANTHVSTRVMGTFGYLAPEYAASGKLTEKSDVFSFGVVLLELITGRRPVDAAQFMDDSLVDWARPLLTRALDEENYDVLADPRLQNDYNRNEMARVIACAAACVRHSARRRPRMSQVVRALEGDVSLADLNEGIKPGHSSVYSSHGSSDYDTSQYNEDMKKFRKLALASREYGSSEYSGPTSEYGLYPSGSSSEAQTTRDMEMGKIKKESSGFNGGSSL